MRKLACERMPLYSEVSVLVTSASTIRVKHNTYSVPSRLIGEHVRARLHEDQLEVWYAGSLQLRTPRLLGRNRNHVDYRHVIWSLVRKPGAFARYRYRDALFPSLTFRKAFDWLIDNCSDRVATMEYLRILHLAASTMQQEVETALSLLLESREPISIDATKSLVMPRDVTIPALEAPVVDLAAYDRLLGREAAQ